ncbi:MAG TPA: NAD(P)/FAD-dependent oxidoreductase [Candidatus Deferrimicrobium sp.]|nr:NAD(P)/FAD-dependent oxidoreductase [Candidatus Deferrimicrobium sp.]
MNTNIYDVIIVGGGPGGLQAALQLGRYKWRTLIVDRGKGRASFVPQYMNILGFPSGVSGQALLKAGRAQAKEYGVEFLTKVVTNAVKDSDGLFNVTLQDKGDYKAGNSTNIVQYRCRKLILNTGVMDRHPDVKDVFRWAGKAIYYCPDCDGYEVSNKKVVVVGIGNGAAELALALLNWTREIKVVNVEPERKISEERLEKLAHFGIEVYSDKLKEFIGETKDRIDKLILQNGTELSCEKVFSALGKFSINSELAEGLGVETSQSGNIIVDPRTKETNVSGCWAVGDVVAAHSQQVTIAIADGVQAAIWVNKQLKQEGFLPAITS